jgi:RecA-family ATPase
MTAIDLCIDVNSDKYERQSIFVRKLAILARRFNACIILVAHRRKSNGYSDDSNDEISGSGDITNLAGVVLSYDRLSKKDLENGRGNSNDRKLILAKNRLFGTIDTEGQILHYDPKSKRIYGDDDNKDLDFGIFGDGFINTNDLRAEDEFNPFS